MTEDESPATRHFDRLLSTAKVDQGELGRLAGLNKNTITAVRQGRASARSVAKVEAAFSQILGTRVVLGEETIPAEPATPEQPSELTDADLLAELGYRLTRLQRENEQLRQRLREAAGQALAEPLTDAEVFDFPQPTDPGPVPDWALDDAANHITEPKGRTYTNQDEERG